jgi:hypothetical protein
MFLNNLAHGLVYPSEPSTEPEATWPTTLIPATTSPTPPNPHLINQVLICEAPFRQKNLGWLFTVKISFKTNRQKVFVNIDFLDFNPRFQ